MKTVERFSNRVENYVKYRPSYPVEIIGFLKTETNFQKTSIVADIGSGTGISSKLFLENGNRVYGIEPNREMRLASEDFLREFSNFYAVAGTAENTTLPDKSVDFAVAAQAYHWFEAEKTVTEIRRILRENGFLLLIWNERELDSNEFLREYEKFLLKYGTDYVEVRHDRFNKERLSQEINAEFAQATFENKQVVDFKGLLGRVLSVSYMPTADAEVFPKLEKELFELFTKHAKNGRIELLYKTNVFYSKL